MNVWARPTPPWTIERRAGKFSTSPLSAGVAVSLTATRVETHSYWEVGDPAEATLDEVRAIRDEIDMHVGQLLGKISVAPAGSASS